jgi:hypothetical protein
MHDSGASRRGNAESRNVGTLAKLVVPGLVPGIHVLVASKEERRGWPGRARP